MCASIDTQSLTIVKYSCIQVPSQVCRRSQSFLSNMVKKFFTYILMGFHFNTKNQTLPFTRNGTATQNLFQRTDVIQCQMFLLTHSSIGCSMQEVFSGQGSQGDVSLKRCGVTREKRVPQNIENCCTFIYGCSLALIKKTRSFPLHQPNTLRLHTFLLDRLIIQKCARRTSSSECGIYESGLVPDFCRKVQTESGIWTS